MDSRCFFVLFDIIYEKYVKIVPVTEKEYSKAQSTEFSLFSNRQLFIETLLQVKRGSTENSGKSQSRSVRYRRLFSTFGCI